MSLELALDCRYFLGDRPCRFKKRCRCNHYDSMGHRILIIKLGALGDVVRTACLLPSLKRAYPVSHITWISLPNGVRILKGHPLINQLFAFDTEGIMAVQNQTFDLVISLDKEAGPTGLCNAVQCSDKRGIRMSAWGTAVPTDAKVEPYFELGLDDDLKFHRNTKTYPELIHEALGFEYQREPYRLYPSDFSIANAQTLFAPWKTEKRRIVGLNTGSGRVFAHKAPGGERWVELARRLLDDGVGVVLLGGPDEESLNHRINEQCDGRLYSTGNRNTESEFTAIVKQCDVVVTGDTLGLHVAVSQDVATVALFGPTCEQEIDLFDNGIKLVTPQPCSPCYRRSCDMDPHCMDTITAESIYKAVKTLLVQRRTMASDVIA